MATILSMRIRSEEKISAILNLSKNKCHALQNSVIKFSREDETCQMYNLVGDNSKMDMNEKEACTN